MDQTLSELIHGYQAFREEYASGRQSVMKNLSKYGQNPKAMIIACCDSRADPAIILQTDPGDLFVVRNVANIVPPYEKDHSYHGTSAALEFGIKQLNIKHIIILGHSQCGGILALLNPENVKDSDFISDWVSILKTDDIENTDIDTCIKNSLHQSKKNCLSFPWIEERVNNKDLSIHLWHFEIKTGKVFSYSDEKASFEPLETFL